MLRRSDGCTLFLSVETGLILLFPENTDVYDSRDVTRRHFIVRVYNREITCIIVKPRVTYSLNSKDRETKKFISLHARVLSTFSLHSKFVTVILKCDI